MVRLPLRFIPQIRIQSSDLFFLSRWYVSGVTLYVSSKPGILVDIVGVVR